MSTTLGLSVVAHPRTPTAFTFLNLTFTDIGQNPGQIALREVGLRIPPGLEPATRAVTDSLNGFRNAASRIARYQSEGNSPLPLAQCLEIALMDWLANLKKNMGIQAGRPNLTLDGFTGPQPPYLLGRFAGAETGQFARWLETVAFQTLAKPAAAEPDHRAM